MSLSITPTKYLAYFQPLFLTDLYGSWNLFRFQAQPLRKTKSCERFTSKEVNESTGTGDKSGGSQLRSNLRSGTTYGAF